MRFDLPDIAVHTNELTSDAAPAAFAPASGPAFELSQVADIVFAKAKGITVAPEPCEPASRLVMFYSRSVLLPSTTTSEGEDGLVGPHLKPGSLTP